LLVESLLQNNKDLSILELSKNVKPKFPTILILIENMISNNRVTSLEVKLDDSSIVYCKNDRSVHLDSIKLISPGILRRFSEIRKIKINSENKHKDNLAMLCKFLVKCDELKSLDLGSNNIGMEEHFSSRPHFIQKSNGMHNFFAIGWIFIIFMVSRDHIYVPSKK
jgi:hypothetical protein